MVTNTPVLRPRPAPRAPSAPQLQDASASAAATTSHAPSRPPRAAATCEPGVFSLPMASFAAAAVESAPPAPAQAKDPATPKPSATTSLRANLRPSTGRAPLAAHKPDADDVFPSVLRPLPAHAGGGGLVPSLVSPSYTSLAPGPSPRGRAPFNYLSSPPCAPPIGKGKPLSGRLQAQFGLRGRYSVLTTANTAYCFAPASARGSYGKIHLAINAEAPHEQLALKAVRRIPKAGTDRLFCGAKTAAMSQQAIVDEYGVHRRVREGINLLVHRLRSELLFGEQAPLAAFVSVDRPSWVYDLIFDDAHRDKSGQPSPKAYIVSTFVSGTAHGVMRHIGADATLKADLSLRRVLTRNFLFQTFTELYLMHEFARQGHFDLTLGNVHVNAHGSFQLADFGFSLPLDARLETSFAGHRGSIAVPEMIALPGAQARRPLTDKADVMVLWLLGLQLLGGSSARMPFYWLRQGSDGQYVYDADRVTHNLSALYKVRAKLAWHPNGLPLVEVDASGHPLLPASGTQEVDRFLRRAARVDLQLFRVAMAIGLNCDPAARLGAGEQARSLAPALLDTSDADRARLRAFFADYGHDPERDAAHNELRRFNELRLAQQRAQRIGSAARIDPFSRTLRGEASANPFSPLLQAEPLALRLGRVRAHAHVQTNPLASASNHASPMVAVG